MLLFNFKPKAIVHAISLQGMVDIIALNHMDCMAVFMLYSINIHGDFPLLKYNMDDKASQYELHSRNARLAYAVKLHMEHKAE